MREKCEWKNGKLRFCEEHKKKLDQCRFRKMFEDYLKSSGESFICPHCGADITYNGEENMKENKEKEEFGIPCYDVHCKPVIENEWKELDIANLPSDILVGDYEFESYSSWIWKDRGGDIISKLRDADNGVNYRYRKLLLENKHCEYTTYLQSDCTTKYSVGDKVLIRGCVCELTPVYTERGELNFMFIPAQSAIIPPEK